MAKLDYVVQSVKQDYALLCKEMNAIKAAMVAFRAAYGKLDENPRKRSAASRAKTAAAQRARWAKAQGNVVTMPNRDQNTRASGMEN
jgi:peptidoglycan hydrolase CwlO-like protein